jgi:hypothetical protein
MALRPLLTDASWGLTMQQQPIADLDVRVPILAPIVLQMLQYAHRQCKALIWQTDPLVHIKNFRAILAVCTT